MFNMFILNMRQIFFLPDVLFILKIQQNYFQKKKKKKNNIPTIAYEGEENFSL